MSLVLQPKYITCKIDAKKLFNSIIKLLKAYNDETFEENEFRLVYNEDLEIYEIKYLGIDRQVSIRKCNIIKDTFGLIEEQDFTNIVLKKLFNIEEGKGCILFHSDYFNEDNYYYILMPYETFEIL